MTQNKDLYPSFAALARSATEGQDFRRHCEKRPSPVAVLAPHGGSIEPGTSELARAIAGNHFSFYLFEGLAPDGGSDLHITSTRFDDPLALNLLENSALAVTIHGMRGKHPDTQIGGLHEHLCKRLVKALNHAGFPAERHHSGSLSGRHPLNLCNRALSGMGVQIEISEGQRRTLFAGLRRAERKIKQDAFYHFAAVVQELLLDAVGPLKG